MNQYQAFEEEQGNTEIVDSELNSPDNIPCTHPITTVCDDGSMYAIICDTCGKGFTESEWTEYCESKLKQANIDVENMEDRK